MPTGQVSPGGVLAVTFTNKAAKEMMTRLSAHAAGQHARHVGRHLPRPVQPVPARALPAWPNLPQSFQILDTQDQLSPIKRLMKAHNIDDERYPPQARLQWFIAGCQGRGPAARTTVEAHDELTRRQVEHLRSCTTSSASAKAWSISPSCCCAATSCCATTSRCASTTSAASRTSWSTSSRTPTRCSTRG